jgi:hypothetical protein
LGKMLKKIPNLDGTHCKFWSNGYPRALLATYQNIGLSLSRSGRLTISAARTDVALFIHRAVRPCGLVGPHFEHFG